MLDSNATAIKKPQRVARSAQTRTRSWRGRSRTACARACGPAAVRQGHRAKCAARPKTTRGPWRRPPAPEHAQFSRGRSARGHKRQIQPLCRMTCRGSQQRPHGARNRSNPPIPPATLVTTLACAIEDRSSRSAMHSSHRGVPCIRRTRASTRSAMDELLLIDWP